MTNSHPHRKPTRKQLKYLRYLAMRAGVSFVYPQTFAQASAEIKRLERLCRTDAAERRREDREVRAAAAPGGALAEVRDHELGGYGSTAHWR